MPPILLISDACTLIILKQIIRRLFVPTCYLNFEPQPTPV